MRLSYFRTDGYSQSGMSSWSRTETAIGWSTQTMPGLSTTASATSPFVGVWDLGRSDDPLNLKVAPLGKWPKARWDAVQEQAERIGDMIGVAEVTIERVAEPVSLPETPRNRFLLPLSGS